MFRKAMFSLSSLSHERMSATGQAMSCGLTAQAGLRTAAAALLLCGLIGALSSVQAFEFDDVAKKAFELSKNKYKKPDSNLPKEVSDLSQDEYRDIRFDMKKTLWNKDKLPFDVSFYHEGSFFNYPVKINEINGRKQKEIKFEADDFSYGKTGLTPQKVKNLGFAGFRVSYPLNKDQIPDEFLSFLGASYFRGLGKDQQYGLSSRGLAIDTGLSSGEEFPRFVEFWIERPAARSKQMTIYALLDSPRAAGAYQFVIHPGNETTMDVKARLYLRANVTKLGLAPLTSMYFFGENQPAQYDDYRPEVHDSDGLSIQSGTGEWIWRPLVNPKRLLITSYSLSNPTGFGLMQRDRNFDDYQDLDARYDQRPSAWVQPKGAWGAGRVELVQIPTPDENNDNIVAYWVPDEPPIEGKPFNIDYTLHWQKNQEKTPPLSAVTRTLRGNSSPRPREDGVGFSVDFEGPVFAKLNKDVHPEAVLSSDDNGKILSSEVVPNQATGGWRMRLRVRRLDDTKPVEMRAFLRSGNTTLSETWSYILPPN